MHAMQRSVLVASVVAGITFAPPALGDLFTFSTGNPDGRLGTASRPGSAGVIEIESADDSTAVTTSITGGSFTGLLTGGATTARSTRSPSKSTACSPPTRTSGERRVRRRSATSQVPTRVNSPSDVEFVDRSTVDGNLSVQLQHAVEQLYGRQHGDQRHRSGAASAYRRRGTGDGAEIQCALTFTAPFMLPADHYFFVPQVALTDGTFLWLSAPRPIVAPGTPLMPDLQSWIRDGDLAPDWLRVCTDIVGGTTFNAAFSLTGATVTAVAEPGTLALLLVALGAARLLATRRETRL